MSERPSFTMLHTSDTHLGCDLVGGPSALGLARAVEFANAQRVDVFLIAGDLFDHARVADDVLDETAATLDSLKCPVVLIPGNHDLYHATSVLRRLRPRLPDANVHLLSDEQGETVYLPELQLTIWGRGMVEHTPDFRPLANVPKRPQDGWAVIASHGLIVDSDEPSTRSSPIYPRDLDEIDWDYVALGHIHVHRIIRTAPALVCYSGATGGPTGNDPGVTIVEFEAPSAVRARWQPLNDPSDSLDAPDTP